MAKFPPVSQQMDRILRGTHEVIPAGELEEKLERSRRDGTPLVVKQGFDPTRPDLHLGHAVSLRKLADFQALGHRVVFVIGDYTARIGDPSGRDATRPVLSEEQIEENLVTYREQVFQLLDPESTEIRRNGDWLSGLDLADVLGLTGRYTVARMLERDDFSARYERGEPITIAEFLYPMMQAYDSIELSADVELGGTDQRFNLLLGRTLQEKAGQSPQACVIMPLLRGTDGVRKMSKSYDNYVGLAMDAEEIFGRTMSIPDDVLPEWIRLTSSATGEEMEERLVQASRDPLAAKRWLAGDLARQYRGAAAAGEAREAFDRVHREGGVPDDVDRFEAGADRDTGTLWVGYALQEAGLASSTSEAIRLLEQGGVRVDGRVAEDRDLQLEPGSYLLQRGKRRFARLEVRAG